MCHGEKLQRPRGSSKLEGTQGLKCGCSQEFKRMEVQECKGTEDGETRRCRLFKTTVIHLDLLVLQQELASISAGQGEAGTLANCLYENMLTTSRKDWQGTKLLVMSRNKDTSLKVSAGILEEMADQYMLQSWFSRTCSRQNVEREA